MKNIYLVLGYGIPTNIYKDENYNFYLKTVFNKIFDNVTREKINKPLIFFCGGKTDLFRPYKRTEATEMIKFFKLFIKRHLILKSITKDWIFIAENKSLSTLENLVYSKEVLDDYKIRKISLVIFCEQTRAKRVEIISRRVFKKNFPVKVVPIDFDVSDNRYLQKNFINKKEKSELNHSLWALQIAENMKKHHEVFVEKIEYMKKVKSKEQVSAMRQWWEQKLKEMGG